MANIQSSWNTLWVQPDGPGTVCRLLSCYAVDAITEGKGGHTPNWCWDPFRAEYVNVGITQDPPDLPSGTFEGLLSEEADYLEKMLRKGCPGYFYINSMKCPPRDSFNGWVRGKSLHNAMLESEDEGSLLMRDSQELSTVSRDFVFTKVGHYLALDEFRRTLTETEEANDICFVGGPRCLSGCGPEIEHCQIGYIGMNALNAATADVLYTTNSGVTWAATSADPFPVTEDVQSVVAVPMGGNIWRLIVANGTTAPALKARIAYADVDIIATPGTTTWTVVAMGANADYFPWNGSLFALDASHIWGGTDGGEIYFSEDAGVTWTAQGAAAADMIRCIRFLDANFGVAVGGTTGASHVLLYTTNGGNNWGPVTFTGPGATVMANAVAAFSESCWIVGFENGTIYKTWDQGANWTLLPQPTVPGLTAWGDVNAIDAIDETLIFACAEATVSGDSVGVIMRSVNGGYNWDAWATAAGDGTEGMQSVKACHYNQAFAVGDTDTTTMVYEVTD